MRTNLKVTLVAAAVLALPSAAAAQTGAGVFVEGLGGAVVPTFEIADVATMGPAFGATIGFRANPRWVLMAEFDYGMHEDEPTGTSDITTLHYMAKAGYSLTGPRARGWEAIVNLGAGVVTFDVEGEPEPFTYPAINAGAKLSYSFNETFAVVFSPQGDIAFSEEEEVGTSNAWVWPITAGVRVSF